MRIPKFIKQIVKFVDSEASRYALGGVLCEHVDGVSTLTATDGRYLTSVSFKDDLADTEVNAIVDGKTLAKAATAVDATKGVAMTMQVQDGIATLRNCGRAATAEVKEGKFPRYRDVFDGKDGAYACVKLDPKMLKVICELYAAVVSEVDKGVDIWVPHDPTKATFFCRTTTEGEVVRTVLMPLASDYPQKSVPEFPAAVGAVLAEAAEDAEPAAEADSVDDTPAPPPELVDSDTLAPTFADIPDCGGLPV